MLRTTTCMPYLPRRAQMKFFCLLFFCTNFLLCYFLLFQIASIRLVDKTSMRHRPWFTMMSLPLWNYLKQISLHWKCTRRWWCNAYFVNEIANSLIVELRLKENPFMSLPNLSFILSSPLFLSLCKYFFQISKFHFTNQRSLPPIRITQMNFVIINHDRCNNVFCKNECNKDLNWE